jgi:hypothetical protein
LLIDDLSRLVNLLLGFPVISVKIFEPGADNAGRAALTKRGKVVWSTPEPWADLVTALGGSAAEARYDKRTLSDVLSEQESNKARVDAHLATLMREGHFQSERAASRFALGRLDELMNRHYGAISKLASTLYRQGRLDQMEILEHVFT